MFSAETVNTKEELMSPLGFVNHLMFRKKGEMEEERQYEETLQKLNVIHVTQRISIRYVKTEKCSSFLNFSIVL